jgi:hypothetical protein
LAAIVGYRPHIGGRIAVSISADGTAANGIELLPKGRVTEQSCILPLDCPANSAGCSDGIASAHYLVVFRIGLSKNRFALFGPML